MTIEWKLYQKNTEPKWLMEAAICTEANQDELTNGFSHVSPMSPSVGDVVFREPSSRRGYTRGSKSYLDRAYSFIGCRHEDNLTRMGALIRASELTDEGNIERALVWLAIAKEL